MTSPAENPKYKAYSAPVYATASVVESTTPPLVTATAIPVPASSGIPNASTTRLGRTPEQFTCPYCSHHGYTKVKGVMTGCGVGGSILLCFVCWPLFWVPLVCKQFRGVVHYCENCNREVGEYRQCI